LVRFGNYATHKKPVVRSGEPRAVYLPFTHDPPTSKPRRRSENILIYNRIRVFRLYFQRQREHSPGNAARETFLRQLLLWRGQISAAGTARWTWLHCHARVLQSYRHLTPSTRVIAKPPEP